MTTDFPTAPSAYGLNGPSATVTVEKSIHASHTEILTLLFSLSDVSKIKRARLELNYWPDEQQQPTDYGFPLLCHGRPAKIGKNAGAVLASLSQWWHCRLTPISAAIRLL